MKYMQLLEQCLEDKKTARIYLSSHVFDGTVIALDAIEVELRNREQSRIIVALADIVAVSIA